MGFEHSNGASSSNDDEITNDRYKRKHKDVELYNKRSELLEKHFGYTNENNPFGDSTLVEPFVWEKKNTAPGQLPTDSITKTVQSKVDEIKQIKHRREQYELEKSLLEEHRNQTQRERDECDFSEWKSRENEFTLKQIIAKSTTRSKEGREKLIDKLVLAIAEGNKDGGNLGINVSVLLSDVSEDDVRELATIAGAYVKLYPQSELNKYWTSILAITENRLNFNHAMHDLSQAVMAKIDGVLSKKSVDELTTYEDEIRKRLDGDGIVDTNFWEAALSRIPYFKACRTINDLVNDAVTETTTPKHVIEKSFVTQRIIEKTEEELDYEKFVKYTKIEEDEELFTDHVTLKNPGQGSDPKYYNRIKKGFEWNKYNQTHYDADNPPPKHVQGYKFNIFYPKLKNSVPRWKLEKDGNQNETAILRFIAGQPYNDIAFRVINKEWNTDPQKGFKNCFDNGVLHLYFNFKKIKYRR